MKYKLAVITGSVLLFLFLWFQGTYVHHVHLLSVQSLLIVLYPIIIVGLGYLCKWLIDKFSKEDSYPLVKLFAVGFLLLLMLFIISFVIQGSQTVDIQLHDTYLVIAHSLILLLFILIMGFYLIAYFAVPKVIKKTLNKGLGFTHFWITIIGILFLVGQIQLNHLKRNVGGSYSFQSLESFENYALVNNVITVIVMLIIAAQLIFIINVIYSLLKPS